MSDDHGHHPAALTEIERRARALIRPRSLFPVPRVALALELERRAFSDSVVEAYAHDSGPMRGARVVAKAWVDPDFKQRLLADGTAAIAELGFGGPEGDHILVMENTPAVHNVVVCTLCSCYPWPVLGLPPNWYKSPPYRARMVREPRALLQEMGCEVPDEVEIRVWDSSAEIRYMVLPQRPAEHEDATEQELAALVSRDAMIGVQRL